MSGKPDNNCARSRVHLEKTCTLRLNMLADNYSCWGSLDLLVFRVNDCVLKVNNIDLTNVEYRTAVQAISRGEVVNMVSVDDVLMC